MICKTNVFVLSAETVINIRDTTALAIWCYLSAYPERNSIQPAEVPLMVREHFGLGDKRFTDAWLHLSDLGLVEIVGSDVFVHQTVYMALRSSQGGGA